MIRVILAEEFLAHGCCPTEVYELSWARLVIDRFRRGPWQAWQHRWIEVAAPFTPKNWNCDTKLVYPVRDASFNEACGAAVVLCEHMITTIENDAEQVA